MSNAFPPPPTTRRQLVKTALAAPWLLAGCAAAPKAAPDPAPGSDAPMGAQAYRWMSRLSWGATPSQVEAAAALSLRTYLAQQLHPKAAPLPAAAQSQVDALQLSRQPFPALVLGLEQRRREADAIKEDDARKAARQAYEQTLNQLAREAATRHVLRALYSPNQIQAQMTWFWLNHFNVYQYKSNLRALVGDYEDQALRPHALGRFRHLLGAVVRHPAMLRYLDNEQNAAGRLNENFARELMELHTLGQTGGYSQRDVQELARVLTGVGVNLGPDAPKLRPEQQALYLRQGLFEFNPARHDFGAKQLLGQPLQARGLAEVDEALDRLCRHPATARFVSRKLAQFWLADEPPPALIARMSESFGRTDGDIAQTLATLFNSPEFAHGGGHKFRDPMHYVMAALRLAYDDKVILNAGPVLNWLNRLGEPLYGRATPDGYALDQAAWASPGQLATRFEVAKAIGSGSAGLFRSEGPQPQERAAFPQLSNALYFQSIRQTLSPATVTALDQAGSAQEWNMLLLAAPEMMLR